MQPDTVIPGAANPQAWNRFSYTLNNPIRFKDPTGHAVSCDAEEDCREARRVDKLSAVDYLKESIRKKFGITMSEKSDNNNLEPKAWNAQNLMVVFNGLNKIDMALNGNLKALVGGATFKWGEHDPHGGTTTYHGLTYGTTISFYTIGNAAIRPMNIFHEFGHLMDNSPGMVNAFSRDEGINNQDFLDDNGRLDTQAFVDPNHDMIQHPMSIVTDNQIKAQEEHWADIFANYVAGNINLASTAGGAMNTFVTGALSPYTGAP